MQHWCVLVAQRLCASLCGAASDIIVLTLGSSSFGLSECRTCPIVQPFGVVCLQRAGAIGVGAARRRLPYLVSAVFAVIELGVPKL